MKTNHDKVKIVLDIQILQPEIVISLYFVIS